MSTNNKKTLGLFVIALVLGLVGAGLATLYLNNREAELRDLLTPKQQMVAVIVAKQDLVKGDILNGDTLAVREIPNQYLDNNAVTPDRFDDIEGQVLIQNLAAGKPLLNSYIGREFPLDFSDTIPEKRRAMTIQVDEINSIAGLIRPGNRIDLFVNLPPGSDPTGQQVANEVIPVLENVEVLATGRDSARDYEEKVRLLRGGVGALPDQNFTTLTLNVTPRQGALITIAQDKGDILALLRNRMDNGGSGFTKVSVDSIKAHAQTLAAQSAARAAAARLSGNLVVGEDGVIRTRDGKALANQNIIIGEDGSIMTKDGTVLSGRGLSINDKGELIDANGNVIDPDKIRVAEDGSLITEDGVVLGGAKTQQAGKLTTLADGTVVSENGIALSGATLNEDGKLVLADGTVVDPNDVIVRADGTVMTKDGKLLNGVKAGQLAGDLRTDSDGNIITANGAIIKGAKLNKDGKLILADGTVVDPNDIIINADGTVTRKDGTVLAGLSAENSGLPGTAGGATGAGYEVDYIVGGVSKDSVATVNKVPVLQ